MSDCRDWLRLVCAPGIGPVGQRRLLKAFGTPQEVFANGQTAIARLLGDRAAALDGQEARDRVAAAEAWLESGEGRLITLADPGYPPPLLDLADPPCALFALGAGDSLSRPGFAIVGSRSATAGGLRNAAAFGRAMSEAGYGVVSGLALGIDGAAHQGALDGPGGTIAVLGTGPDRVYPARHRELAHRIAQSGAILSEFPPGTPPVGSNFPRRNRLIAALSRGVLVVEAALESGSLITARLAGELGREVFAIPGSIHSPQSRGCHRLIRDGAQLVESVDDILSQFGSGGQSGRESRPPVPVPEVDQWSAAILSAMGHDPCSVDQICAGCGLAGEAVMAGLLELELSGKVFVRPGGYFQRSG